jgi:glutamyl-tRNA synthetase
MIVTRIAPSPTGKFLHIGNLRTLLYNYFLAKRHGGKFLVRLEDTDRDRYTPLFLQYFKDTCDWLGIKPDASYWNPDPKIGSFIQSERDYSDKIKFLLDNGFAYYAFDSKEDLEVLRQKGLKYDATTRLTLNNSFTNKDYDISKNPYVVRFAVPENEIITFNDSIRGEITTSSNILDDKVLLKSNGVGSYHLCNVCDDHDMGVTNVLRGDEWIPSTPFHILLYKAFGWNIPTFAHLPLIMNPDGKGKLSKRTAAKYGIPIAPIGYTDDNGVYQKGWKDLGYETDAFMNALALVGWNPGDDKEVLSMDDMINSFTLDRVHKAGARFDMAKATWINSQWIQNKVSDVDLINNIDLPNLSDDQKSALITEGKKRCNFKHDFVPIVNNLFNRKDNISIDDSDKNVIINVIDELDSIVDWTFDNISNGLTQFINDSGLKSGKVLSLLRKTIVYNGQGIDVKNSMFILGKDETIERLKEYLVSEII